MILKEKILEVLKNEDLSVNQMYDKLPGCNQDSIKTIISLLIKDNLIMAINGNKRYRTYALIQKETWREDFEFLKSLFENEKIIIDHTKITKEELRRLDEI